MRSEELYLRFHMGTVHAHADIHVPFLSACKEKTGSMYGGGERPIRDRGRL